MTPQDLKNSILQLAMQGRLVEQRPEEGTAEELYCQIQEEKKRLIKEGKIKKEKPLPEVRAEEEPFKIPETWKWVRLENAIEVIPSKRYQVLESEVHEEGLYPVISQAHEFYIGYSDDTTKVFHPSSPVVLFGDHTVEIKIVNSDFVVGADGVKIFSPKQGLFPSFLYYVLQYLCTNLNKIGGYSRHYKFIKNKQIPLPPLEEQKRIVEKLDELMPLCDRYEKTYDHLQILTSRFPSDIQASILQEAIRGRLVEQRPEEGTAEELYCQIQEEKERLVKEGKIKKEKPLPEVRAEEEPFEIPKTWKWVRLGEIGSWQSGSTPLKTNADYYKGTIPWLKIGDLNDGYVSTSTETISETALEKLRLRLNPAGSVLMAMYGSIGKLAILDIPMTTNQAICACIPYKGILNKYLFYSLMSLRNDFIDMGAGCAQQNISKEKIINYFVPLPPLAEQRRIVAKIEELMPLVDRYKKAWSAIDLKENVF